MEAVKYNEIDNGDGTVTIEVSVRCAEGELAVGDDDRLTPESAEALTKVMVDRVVAEQPDTRS